MSSRPAAKFAAMAAAIKEFNTGGNSSAPNSHSDEGGHRSHCPSDSNYPGEYSSGRSDKKETRRRHFRRSDGGGSSSSRPPIDRNPRSREDRAWKHFDKIRIDDRLFPHHVRAAAVIIGVRGCNHARLQDESGCCIQLRGKGISSPGTPGADDPMHLWVKYDSKEQLDKVKEVLEEIIRNCQSDGGTSHPPAASSASRKRENLSRHGSSGGHYSSSHSSSHAHHFEDVPSMRTQSSSEQDLLHDQQPASSSAIRGPAILTVKAAPKPPRKPGSPPTALVEFLWTLHLLAAHSSHPVEIDRVSEIYQNFYGFPLEKGRFLMPNASFINFVGAFPNVLRIEGGKSGQPEYLAPSMDEHTTWSGFNAANPMLRTIPCPLTAQQLHAMKATRVRHPFPSTSHPQRSPAAPPGRSDLPMTPCVLLLQGLHVLISTKRVTLSSLLSDFEEHWNIKFDLSYFQLPDIQSLVLHYPELFTLKPSPDGDFVLGPKENPDFSVVVSRDPTSYTMEELYGLPSATSSGPKQANSNEQVNLDRLHHATEVLLSVGASGDDPVIDDLIQEINSINAELKSYSDTSGSQTRLDLLVKKIEKHASEVANRKPR
eukprot:GHVP01035256.1.p1 GENE.GHVP01035256.1~~GHVP01035256.1.p1  ORF type:complete len:598 (-),score=115.12 GHVP01035256.1:2939-4732(-)